MRFRILLILTILCIFLGIVAWFTWVDVYRQDFFKAGAIVPLYNLFRVAFAAIFCWIVYVTGRGVIAVIAGKNALSNVTPAEQAVLGFGTGVGIWHLIVLILGVIDLYYRAVMVGLCLLVLCVSARHLTDIACALGRAIARYRDTLLGDKRIVATVGTLIATIAAFWLLAVKGLYPGGGGDYYTHYFYYYLDVINSHGLRPNDVWYQYYYSKGAGLFFLGMLLTDPEAPEVVSFCLVVFAALAIATLSARIAPKSFWPACGASLYLLFYLVSIDVNWGGAEFQKEHPEICALVMLAAWALCMNRFMPREGSCAYLVMAASCTVGASIVTQAAGMLLGLYFGVGFVWAMIRRQAEQFLRNGVLCVTAGLAVFGMLLSNYIATGLATDQALRFMLKFANFERLNQWGVIPQLIAVAWIRGDYQHSAPALLSWDNFRHLYWFMRLDALGIMLGSAAVAGIIYAVSSYTRRRRGTSAPFRRTEELPTAVSTRSAAVTSGLILGSIISTFGIASLVVARVQYISYLRFSGFFFPLLLLLAIALWTAILEKRPAFSHRWHLPIIVPCVLLVAVPFSWHQASYWGDQVLEATADALHFVSGEFSLSDAYSHQIEGERFGGIEPGTFAAMRQVGPNIPIWSTNVASYCMVPGCLVESVISFKMSGHLDEVLNGTPEQARQLLRTAGLNYFLFSNKFQLLDILPYSRLFSPDTIAQYLGIKWTDGTTYLLTWRGAGTVPLNDAFMIAYKSALSQAEVSRPASSWFQFGELPPYMHAVMTKLRAAPHPWTPSDFSLPRRQDVFTILSATYGASCYFFRPRPPATNWVSNGNVTSAIRNKCHDKIPCDVKIDVVQLGDPASGCAKDFSVTYRCGDDLRRTISIGAEANGQSLVLDCGPAH